MIRRRLGVFGRSLASGLAAVLRGIADRLAGPGDADASLGAGPDGTTWPPEIAARLDAGPPAHWLDYVRRHAKHRIDTARGASGTPRVARGATHEDTPRPSVESAERVATPAAERPAGVSGFASRRARNGDESREALDRAARGAHRPAPTQGDVDDDRASASRPRVRGRSDDIADRRIESHGSGAHAPRDNESRPLRIGASRKRTGDVQSVPQTTDAPSRRTAPSADDDDAPIRVDHGSRPSPARSARQEPSRPTSNRGSVHGPHSAASVESRRARAVESERADTTSSDRAGAVERRTATDADASRAALRRAIPAAWQQRMPSSSASAGADDTPFNARGQAWFSRDGMGELQSPVEREEPLPWPDLMPDPPADAEVAEAVARESARLHRLDAEQRGYPWNA